MEGVNLWLLLAAGAVVFGGIFVYVLFMVFLPEWVGITGKVALEAERSHQEGAKVEENDLLAKLHQTSNSPQDSLQDPPQDSKDKTPANLGSSENE